MDLREQLQNNDPLGLLGHLDLLDRLEALDQMIRLEPQDAKDCLNSQDLQVPTTSW